MRRLMNAAQPLEAAAMIDDRNDAERAAQPLDAPIPFALTELAASAPSPAARPQRARKAAAR